MTKEDFYIIRNSVTMEQVISSYGIYKNRKGLIYCPFHADGSERTPSMSIRRYGFRCFGCGASGDMIKFVADYENITNNEAALTIAERFSIPISEHGRIDEKALQKVQEAIKRHQNELYMIDELNAIFSDIGAKIRAYETAKRQVEPFSDAWCFVVNELPILISRWEECADELWKMRHRNSG